MWVCTVYHRQSRSSLPTKLSLFMAIIFQTSFGIGQVPGGGWRLWHCSVLYNTREFCKSTSYCPLSLTSVSCKAIMSKDIMSEVMETNIISSAPESSSKGRWFESRQERRDNLLLRGQFSFCADSYFGIRSIPVLPQQHVKDPGRTVKGSSGRLQPNEVTL